MELKKIFGIIAIVVVLAGLFVPGFFTALGMLVVAGAGLVVAAKMYRRAGSRDVERKTE